MCGTGGSSHRLLKANKAEWAKRCSYIGIFVVFFTATILAFWGNLSVYTESYFRERLGPHIKMSPPWLLSFCTIGESVGGILAGRVASRIGRKWTLVIACTIFDSGLFLSALVVTRSAIGLDFSLGLLGGLAQGLTLNTGLHHVMSFEPKYVGLVTAAITSGRYVGGACWNQLITWYINPANLVPDLIEGRQKYFTQAEVLDRVPSVFLVLGVVVLCCHVLGISLIRPNDEDVENEGDSSFHPKKAGDDKHQMVKNRLASSKIGTELPDETGQEITVSPREMLTKTTFYLLCYIIISAQYTDVLFITFFKPYGLMWIPDDLFLSSLFTVILLTTIGMQPLLGGLLDVCGLKYATILLSFMLCMLSNFWFFMPMVSRWLYFAWAVIYDACVSGFLLYMPVMTLKLFGSEHFSTNYGIVMCSPVMASFFAPSVIQVLFDGFGYFYVFLSGGCICTLGVILTIIYLPRA